MRKMKDSGIEWIGEMPDNWEVLKLKYLSYMKGRIGWQGLNSTDFIDEGPYCVTGTDFVNGTVNWNTCYHVSEERYEMDKFIQIQIGDLLITKDGTIGKLAKITDLPYKACLNSHLLIIRPLYNKFSNEYLYYVLSSYVFWKYYTIHSSGSIMASLSQNKLKDFSFSAPDPCEQKKIVSYLDTQCAHIDSVIEKTKQSIEEYRKLKQAVITQAVTKGVRGEREMKDSEIKWIGDIPKEWSITSVGRLCFVTKLAGFEFTKDMVNNIREEGEVPIVRAQNIKMGRFIDNINEFISLEISKKLNRCALDKKCLLITFIGAGIGEVAIFDNDKRYHLAPNVAKIVINKEYKQMVSEEFLLYYLMSSSGQEEVNKIKKATAQPSLSMETIRSIKILIPSYGEQSEITAYLDQKCAEIDTLITKKEQFLTELESYKKSMIYEYVTGKKEVEQ